MDERFHGLERELGVLEGLCAAGAFPGAQRCLTTIETELKRVLAPGATGPVRAISDEAFWQLFERLRDAVLGHQLDQIASAASDFRSALASYERRGKPRAA